MRRDELVEDADAFRENEERIRGLESELERRQRLIDRRKGDVEAAGRELEQAHYEGACSEMEQAPAARGKASKSVARCLADLVAAITELRA